MAAGSEAINLDALNAELRALRESAAAWCVGARRADRWLNSENAMDIDLAGFHEVVRHPRAHALVLQQYRIGEYAGVVGLKRLLGDMQPEGKLHRAMEIHYRDEDRHSRVFTDWIYRLGVEPEPMPTQVESYFSSSPEEFRKNRELLEQMPPDTRRIVTFGAINALERLAYNQFETHLLALDRREDIETLEASWRRRSFT